MLSENTNIIKKLLIFVFIKRKILLYEYTFYSMYGQTTGIFFYHKSMQCSLFNIYGSTVFTALMNILIFLIVSDAFTTKCFKILKEFYRRQGFSHKYVNKIYRMKITEYNFFAFCSVLFWADKTDIFTNSFIYKNIFDLINIIKHFECVLYHGHMWKRLHLVHSCIHFEKWPRNVKLSMT